MAGFDFTRIRYWQAPRGAYVLQADKEALRLKLSASGRVFVVTGADGAYTLALESYQISQRPQLIKRSNNLQHILQLIGYTPYIEVKEKTPSMF